MKEIEDFLGRLCETGIDEDFIEVLDKDTYAVVTYHEDSSGQKMMRVDFWRSMGEPIRMIFPIIKRESRRIEEVIVRETVRAAEDVGRETRNWTYTNKCVGKGWLKTKGVQGTRCRRHKLMESNCCQALYVTVDIRVIQAGQGISG